MKDKNVPLHKRLAMGDSLKGYAKGGLIGCGVGAARPPVVTPVGGGAMVPRGGGNPLTTAKRNNGIPVMKKGGKVAAKGRDRD